jgi:hypothetical protein
MQSAKEPSPVTSPAGLVLLLNAAAIKLAIKNTSEMAIMININILDLLLVALIQSRLVASN